MLQGWNPSFLASQTRLDYTYTLTQQGLEGEVDCSYEKESPVQFRAIEGLNSTLVIATNGTCDPNKGLKPALRNVVDYVTLNTNNTLTFWACASNQSSSAGGPDNTTFILFLRGRANYRTSIGNITCTLSKFRAQDYDVTFTRSQGYFVAGNVTTLPETSRNTVESFLGVLVRAFGSAVWKSQAWDSNTMAESVFDIGQRFLGVAPIEQNETHLRLFEAMIQGIMEYHVGTSAHLVSGKIVYLLYLPGNANADIRFLEICYGYSTSQLYTPRQRKYHL
jgi:hypothetical protein